MCVVSFNLEEVKLESFYKHKILDNNVEGVYFYFVRLCLKMSQLVACSQRSVLILGRAIDLHYKLYLTYQKQNTDSGYKPFGMHFIT